MTLPRADRARTARPRSAALAPALATLALILTGVLLVACGPQTTRSADEHTSSPANQTVTYPDTATVDHHDTYHGERVADPYRWLEEIDSKQAQDWIQTQNALTFGHLEQIGGRQEFSERLTRLWNYERFGAPLRRGDLYVYSYNDGLMNQSQLLMQRGLDGEPQLLLDPNTLSDDGTVALTGLALSPDGRRLAYGTASGGSDWQQWQVRDIATGQDLPDRVEWVKFSGATWAADGSGFWYARYDEPTGENALKAVNQYQKLYFHRLGSDQAADELVYERSDEPDWGFMQTRSDDDRHLVIAVWRSTENRNLVFLKPLADAKAPVIELIDQFDYEYSYVGNQGSRYFFLTDDQAPRRRLIAIDLDRPGREHWQELIPQSEATLETVVRTGDRFVAGYLRDASSDVRLFELDGRPAGQLDLPGLGTAIIRGERDYDEAFIVWTSFNQPARIDRLDTTSQVMTTFRAPQLNFDPQAYQTRQLFFTSRDGTRVPMFVTARSDIALDGSNPTLLYGYGGFNVPLTPSYSPANMAWLEAGGVYVQVNLRGGGEYGRDWHQAGTGLDKQNVFDDMAAAAEHLITSGWTAPGHLAIHGGSNGGLLAAAVALQRPELFAASVPAVGVLDMLRFREFTIGRAWESDYGSVLDEAQYRAIKAYSPLHTIQAGVDYPAFLITTGDHDDRVFPAHSFKFAAALQAVQPPRPALIRVDVRAGHGAGKPVDKQIAERADMLAFIAHHTGLALD